MKPRLVLTQLRTTLHTLYMPRVNKLKQEIIKEILEEDGGSYDEVNAVVESQFAFLKREMEHGAFSTVRLPYFGKFYVKPGTIITFEPCGLFREENFKVVVDTELKLIPEFKSLITRDRTADKKTAVKEFSYIYFIYDHRSPYYIYPEEERRLRVATDTGLGQDYKPDDKVEAAVAKYLELSKTPTIKSLASIREGLLTSSRLIDSFA